MRALVVGLGTQGYKRKRFSGEDFVGSVDPLNQEADWRSIEQVPLDIYDTVLACVPDEPKFELLSYCVKNGKHILVEKPLWTEKSEDIASLHQLARERDVIIYTAYNHRFEPHYVKLRDLIISGRLGRIFHCRMFYGNGTARLVRNSLWRDQGAGVLPDLGSHLLDTCSFWFGDISDKFSVVSANSFENIAPDHVVIANDDNKPSIELEMTLLMWRNHFTCDILAEYGTAHIESLCKWGPTAFTVRTRVLPSGRPPEESVTLIQDDPTWAAEYEYFKSLCASGYKTDLTKDIWIHDTLESLGKEAVIKAGNKK